VAIWGGVRDEPNTAACRHRYLILPVLGAGAFPESNEEPSEVSKQGGDMIQFCFRKESQAATR
jgi:hypothetical protein